MVKRFANNYEQLVLSFISFKQGEGLKPSYTEDVRGRLFHVGRKCGFSTVREITKERLMEWFLGLSAADVVTGKSILSPASRSLYRKAVYPFLEWCIMMGHYEGDNPADNLPRPKATGIEMEAEPLVV